MEAIRRAIRWILGSESRFYRAGAACIDFVVIAWTNDIKTWRALRRLKHGKKDNEPPRLIRLRNLDHPILLRPGTADAGALINNVIREEYGYITVDNNPKWMIDAGAYIGDSATYFLSKYAYLRVIALEPNPESYRMARLNLEAYGERVILLQKKLYSNEQSQCFSGGETGASVAASGFQIECTTIPALLEQYRIPRLDILKMDIEGAEEAVFSVNPERWLSRIGLLMIEFHGARIQSMISRVLKSNGFTMKKHRSIWYCWREQ